MASFDRPIRSLVVAVLVALAPATGHADGPGPTDHRGLDWQVAGRWVHVDNVDPRRATEFEGARRRWLQALRRDGVALGDGRALFWNARSSTGRTYFSFYPFSGFGELEARRQMIARTDEAVGEAVVDAYDAGDAALVGPHFSQLWRHLDGMDLEGPATAGLSEVTAGAGRLEVRSLDFQRWGELEVSLDRIRSALAGEYPMACRIFMSTYGRGEIYLWWLAPDLAAYRAAPRLEHALARRLGVSRARALLSTLDRVAPIERAYDVERRPDLSNLVE